MIFAIPLFSLMISLGAIAAPIVLEESTVSEKDKVKSNNLRDSIKAPSTFIDVLAKPSPMRKADPSHQSNDYSCGPMKLVKIEPPSPGGNEWYRYKCSDCTTIAITKGWGGYWGAVGSISPRGNSGVKSSLDEAARSSCGE